MEVGESGTRQRFVSLHSSLRPPLQLVLTSNIDSTTLSPTSARRPLGPGAFPLTLINSSAPNPASTAQIDSPRPTTDPSAYPPFRESIDQKYRDRPAMAAAAVAAPSSHYPPQPPYPPPSTMLSNEPRKSPEEEGPSNRQSLPSISEVISISKPGQFSAPPPHPLSHSSALSSPFPSAARAYSDEKHPSPQPMHPTSYPTRQEPLPPFNGSPRSGPYAGRPPLPLGNERRPSPPHRHDGPPHHGHEPHRHPEHHASNGVYPHPHAAPPVSYQAGQLPHGQMPLPAGYPMSPRHQHPPLPGHYEHRAPPHARPEEAEYAARTRYEGSGSGRNFENWDYQDSLSRVRIRGPVM